jgi:hypothetical protein
MRLPRRIGSGQGSALTGHEVDAADRLRVVSTGRQGECKPGKQSEAERACHASNGRET